MENKKKIIIAVIIFIFLGLTIFTFADPNDDNKQKKEGNGTTEKDTKPTEDSDSKPVEEKEEAEEIYENITVNNHGVTIDKVINLDITKEVDEFYISALKAVEKAEESLDENSYKEALELVSKVTDETKKEELINRLEEIKEVLDEINAKELVDTLETKTSSSTNKKQMDSARDYRTQNEIVKVVEELTDEELKSELQTRLSTLAKLLDDTKEPSVNIEDGAILNSITKIEITDDNEFTIELTKDKEETKEIENGTEVSDGKYTLDVIDSVFNEKTITFTVDTITPIIEGVPETGITEKNVTLTVADDNIDTITLTKDKVEVTDYQDDIYELTEEGVYEITVCDIANNCTTATFEIDKTNTIVYTFEELKAALVNGGQINIGANITITEKLIVSNDTMLKGGTLTRDIAYTGNLFTVDSGVTLTLNTVTVDGNNNWSFDYETYNNYLNAASKVTSQETSHKFTTPESGKPIATEDMFFVNGNLNLIGVTIKNHVGNGGASVIDDGNSSAQITMTNTRIEHCTTPNSSTVVSLENGGQWTINEGTVITGNHGGSNGGICRVNYSTGKITMNGGKITNNTAVNSNGTFIMMWNQSTFEMNDGEISNNTGVNGWANGRNAVIYGHTNSHIIINEGTISNNTGTSYGGIDVPYTGVANNTATVVINGGNFTNNVSILNNTNKDLNGYNGNERIIINGGTFTQDVTEWLASDKDVVTDGNGTWSVVDATTIQP